MLINSLGIIYKRAVSLREVDTAFYSCCMAMGRARFSVNFAAGISVSVLWHCCFFSFQSELILILLVLAQRENYDLILSPSMQN